MTRQGIGPAFAIPKVLKKAGLSQDDVDLWEINEAFASQAVMSIETLKIPYEKVNPNGGAIAFGHPLGATGARQVATAYAEAKRNGQKIFVTSMCIGSGMVSQSVSSFDRPVGKILVLISRNCAAGNGRGVHQRAVGCYALVDNV